MKVFRYISAIVMAAVLIACQKENTQFEIPAGGEKVEVTFSVLFPEPIIINTKAESAMGEGPTSLDLMLCLYGAGDGYVQNWIPAQIVSTTTEGGFITGGTYKASLPVTDEPRIVHLFANAPSISNIDYIDNIMEEMVSTDNNGAFWQEVRLPHIKRRSAGSAEPDPTSVAALTRGVHLVRNFAKIIVRGAAPSDPDYVDPHFVVKRWTLINVPVKGYVAPYMGDASNRFPDGYTNIAAYESNGGADLYAQLKDTDNYLGYMPFDTDIDGQYPGDPSSDPDSDPIYAPNGGAQYMYERPLPSTEEIQTAFLVEIEFDSEHPLTVEHNNLFPEDPVSSITYWYKIEVLDNDGAYFPFFRDFVYRIRLEALNDEGSETALEAYNGPYFGNISASLETAGLSELSDGVSLIHVDLMDYTFLTGGTQEILSTTGVYNPDDPNPAQLYFIPDVANPQAYHVSTDGICEITVTQVDVPGHEHAITAFEANETGVITVTLANTGNQVKKSILRVSGKSLTNNAKAIYREITINLMNKQEFKHNSYETAITNQPVVNGKNNPVELTLYRPEDLGASVFPIQIRVEAENNTLSAISPDLPVKSGVSLFDSTRNSFYYIYTIKYSDYCKLNPRTKRYDYYYDFKMTFYTNKTGDNSTKIDIRDLAGNFYAKELTLGTVNP